MNIKVPWFCVGEKYVVWHVNVIYLNVYEIMCNKQLTQVPLYEVIYV